MRMLTRLASLSAFLALGACTTVLDEGDVPPLPPQADMAQPTDAPTAVVITLPPDIYKTIPPRGPGETMATEAQLGMIEDYGLHLPYQDRKALEERVNACRFTAHDSCVIQAAAVAAKG